MKAIEQFERLIRINEMIKSECTGRPDYLCKRLNICRRQLFKDLEVLKDMGAEIAYSKVCETYYYPNGNEIEISYSFRVLQKNETHNINGGYNLVKQSECFFYALY